MLMLKTKSHISSRESPNYSRDIVIIELPKTNPKFLTNCVTNGHLLGPRFLSENFKRQTAERERERERESTLFYLILFYIFFVCEEPMAWV